MKKLALVGGVLVVGAGLTALLIGNQTSRAADHLDAPAAGANSLADINDVYTWMTSDGSKVNLVMTVSPGADTTKHFGPSVQYAFHVTAKPAYGQPGTETKVICTFVSDTSAQCWVGTADYIKGDPSNTAGITSTDGKVRLFAGLRSDPFFFNLQGFRDAVGIVKMAASNPTLTVDAAGCPGILPTDPTNGAGADSIRAALTGLSPKSQFPCSPASKDCFAPLNGLAIVLQIDKTLVSSTANPIISVWASTHAAP